MTKSSQIVGSYSLGAIYFPQQTTCAAPDSFAAVFRESISMLLRSRWNILLVALPVVLFGLLWVIAGQRPQVLPGLGSNATTIAFAPDGKTIVCVSSNN